MGMLHDFAETHGGYGGPCDGQGFMSYGTPGAQAHQWSECSRNDFLAHYNQVAGKWCLSCKPKGYLGLLSL